MEEDERSFITPAIEKRQHRRASLMAQVKCEALGRDLLLITRDVSAGGVFITTREPLPSQSKVRISLRLAPGEGLIACAAKIVNSIPGVGMGAEFEDLDEVSRSSLRKFVDESS